MPTLNARLSNGNVTSVEIDDIQNSTVYDLKVAIQQSTGEELQGMRLVVNGRILQDEEAVLSIYNVKSNDTVHVARTRVTVASMPQPSRRNADPLDGLSDNPFVASMLSNPEFMRSMLQSNPQLQRLQEEHPELRQMIDSPNFAQEVSQMLRNPSLRQEMLRNQDRAISNIESIPGGFTQLSSMFQKMNNGSTFNEPDPSTDEANARMARELLGDRTSPSSSGPNQDALPNPWAPARNSPINPTANPLVNMMNSRNPTPVNPFVQSGLANPYAQPIFPNPMMNPFVPSPGSHNPMQNFMQQYSMMQNAIQPVQPQAPSEPVEVRYRTELDTLKDMGFTNEEQNKRAILAAGGDLDGAVDYIISNQ